MRAVKSKDTTPEMRVRRLAHALGYRYRLHCRDVAGTPDLVFGRRRKAVFVHGCFWHGHGCPRGARAPKTNADYWAGKIRRNRERDAANLAALAADGWRALVVWECETRDAGALAERLRGFLGAPRAPGRAR
jgi:DNA mismatch endonuclease (patch repair protein)